MAPTNPEASADGGVRCTVWGTSDRGHTRSLWVFSLVAMVGLLDCGGGPGSHPPPTTQTNLVGVDYGPFRDGESPYGQCPSLPEIQQDIQTLETMASAVRTYGFAGCNIGPNVLAAISGSNLKLALGLWLSNDPSANSNEISVFQKQVAQGLPANVTTVIVGSEVLLRGDLTVSELVTDIQQVRNMTPAGIQVVTADNWDIWDGQDSRYPDLNPLVQAVSFVFINIHPYYAGTCPDQAASQVFTDFNTAQQKYPNMKVTISETGWPTAGETQGNCAVPSTANQQQFLEGFLCQAQQANIDFYIFEAFDEAWKAQPYPGNPSPLQVEGHWGIYNSNRTPKTSVTTLRGCPA